jgi:hypothetical protein
MRDRIVRHSPGPDPQDHSSPNTLQRRRFLLALSAGGAGAAALAARAIPGTAVTAPADDGPAPDGRYAATAHVRTYYRTAKL